MNAKLKQEIYDLEGEIEHHHNVNQRAKGGKNFIGCGFQKKREGRICFLPLSDSD